MKLTYGVAALFAAASYASLGQPTGDTTIAHMVARGAHERPTAAATGFMEICNEPEGEAPTAHAASFTVADKTYTALAGACTLPIELPAGTVTVTYLTDVGSTPTRISTFPSDRVVRADLAGRTAVVTVVEGDISKQTVVFFAFAD
jgi:hypothetical protein